MTDQAAKKVPKVRVPAAHPTYQIMVSTAVGALKERGGSSRQAISKYVKANYKVSESVDTHLKHSLRRLVTKGVLVHTKGQGASGSFKLVKQAKPEKKAKKPKAAAAKKAVKKPAKKSVAKKSKSPKKAAKKTKKAPAKKAKKSPKKVVKAKKPAKKTVKKTAAKKGSKAKK